MPRDLAAAQALLKDVFGFDEFRPGQGEIVEAVAQGRDVLAIMPTGGGKSLCFQLPALMRGGITVVISPLIALMRDQVRALREAGVAAGALTSGNTDEENDSVWRMIQDGTLRLLYLAPERLASGASQRMLYEAGVGLIAVDEAHCVSQWGHDFRPDYLRIGALRQALDVPLAAFTATADPETREEIKKRLFGDAEPVCFLRGFDRPNLHLAFLPKDSPRTQILRYADARRGRAGIVYCGTRAKTQSLATALEGDGHSVAFYHGGMDPAERRAVEERFANEDGLIVCATVAFGMGVDKPDIRWVAHADLPKSIEAYYQEIGRAGRDGAPAETLTLYGAEDIRLRRAQIDEGGAPPERRSADHVRLNALLGLAEAQTCRRRLLLGYFGEDAPQACNNCDLCARPPETFDGTEVVRKALSAALRTRESFGMGHLIDILLGNMTDKVRQNRHDGLPTFGVGRDLKKSQWQAVFRQMMGFDLMRPDCERHGALVMSESALPILRGEQTIRLRRDTLNRAKDRPVVKALVSEDDAPMLSALKACRNALARQAGLPPYMIFNDRTLVEMAQMRPQTLDDMMRVSGVGTKKLQSYGATFLEVLGREAPELHPARRKLAGRGAGMIYDALQETQTRLMRGQDGTEKPLTCKPALLARLAEQRPRDETALARHLDAPRMERFASAFLDVLCAAD